MELYITIQGCAVIVSTGDGDFELTFEMASEDKAIELARLLRESCETIW